VVEHNRVASQESLESQARREPLPRPSEFRTYFGEGTPMMQLLGAMVRLRDEKQANVARMGLIGEDAVLKAIAARGELAGMETFLALIWDLGQGPQEETEANG
jgi:hypothetical protein